MICGLGQLPITLTGMITHGHVNERYAQYSNELWFNDPNFTIGSLLRLLQTLEKVLICESKILFERPPQNALFACLLQDKSHCTSDLKTPNEAMGYKLLLEFFCFKWITTWRIIKIDICQHLFHCWLRGKCLRKLNWDSLWLVIHIKILADALDICSKSWRNKIIIFWQIWWSFSWFHKRDLSFRSWLKKKDLKTSVLGCLKDGLETLVKHIYLHLFKCFVDLSSWLVMQFKVSLIEYVWSPTNGPPI